MELNQSQSERQLARLNRTLATGIYAIFGLLTCILACVSIALPFFMSFLVGAYSKGRAKNAERGSALGAIRASYLILRTIVEIALGGLGDSAYGVVGGESEPAIQSVVEELVVRMQQAGIAAKPFARIYITADPLVTTRARSSDQILVVGRPVLEILPREEIIAILAHEVGHRHLEQTALQLSIERLSNLIQAVRQHVKEKLHTESKKNQVAQVAQDKATKFKFLSYETTVSFGCAVLDFYLHKVREHSQSIRFKGEIVCDQMAASVTSALTVAHAIRHMSELNFFWSRFDDSNFSYGEDLPELGSLPARFRAYLQATIEEPSSLDEADESGSHPPASARFAALGVELSAVSSLNRHGEGFQCDGNDEVSIDREYIKRKHHRDPKWSRAVQVCRRLGLQSSKGYVEQIDVTALSYMMERRRFPLGSQWEEFFREDIAQLIAIAFRMNTDARTALAEFLVSAAYDDMMTVHEKKSMIDPIGQHAIMAAAQLRRFYPMLYAFARCGKKLNVNDFEAIVSGVFTIIQYRVSDNFQHPSGYGENRGA